MATVASMLEKDGSALARSLREGSSEASERRQAVRAAVLHDTGSAKSQGPFRSPEVVSDGQFRTIIPSEKQSTFCQSRMRMRGD